MFNIFRKSRRAALTGLAVVVVLILGASAGLQRAAEPALPTDKKLSFRDIQLSVYARKALAEDAALAPVNLGVRVQDNVAVLWGPAPSEELKHRAVEIVKKVKGIYEVHDGEVYIAAPAPVIETPPLAPTPEEPQHTESASPDAASETIHSLTSQPRSAVAPEAAVVLQAPLPVSDAGPTRTVSAAPPVEGLSAAVEQLQQSDARFRALDCRLDGDVVILRAGAGRAEDVMAFARVIARVPGLSRIVIQDDDTAAPG